MPVVWPEMRLPEPAAVPPIRLWEPLEISTPKRWPRGAATPLASVPMKQFSITLSLDSNLISPLTKRLITKPRSTLCPAVMTRPARSSPSVGPRNSTRLVPEILPSIVIGSVIMGKGFGEVDCGRAGTELEVDHVWPRIVIGIEDRLSQRARAGVIRIDHGEEGL